MPDASTKQGYAGGALWFRPRVRDARGDLHPVWYRRSRSEAYRFQGKIQQLVDQQTHPILQALLWIAAGAIFGSLLFPFIIWSVGLANATIWGGNQGLVRIAGMTLITGLLLAATLEIMAALKRPSRLAMAPLLLGRCPGCLSELAEPEDGATRQCSNCQATWILPSPQDMPSDAE